MPKTAYHLTVAVDYNGNKNVPFMMRSDDDRLGSVNYPDLGVGEFDRKLKTFTTDGSRWKVLPDWSLREVKP